MRIKTVALLAALACSFAAVSDAQTVAKVLQEAQQAMGDVDGIEYSGTGMNAFFGQALTAGEEWPRRELSSFTRAINYQQRSARDEWVFTQPVFGGQRQNAQVNGDKAWTIGPNGPVPQLGAAEERQLHIWLSPHGFIKGALASGNASLRRGTDGDVISFTALGKYKVDGTLDAQRRIAKVETHIANPVMGDTPVIATYSDYRDFGGVQFPGRILIVQGGFPLLDLTVASVTRNPKLDLRVPDNVAKATIPPVQTASTKLAEGVWHVTGGSHHSVVVELIDHLAVVEAPLDERRSLAVIEEAKKLAPGKPVRYVITTHHHFDHTGGLRTYAAQGATIVTHATNVPFFSQSLVAPATIAPDAQSGKPKEPKLQPVSGKYELTDGNQTIQVYATAGDTHTNEYTLVYLPGPKILIEGDAYSPGPADAPPPATPPPNALRLYEDLQKLELDVATIAPIHGRGTVPFSEFLRFIGKEGTQS